MSVTAVRLGGRPGMPLLVLGPSLGTSATALWSAAAATLAEQFQVVGWDLPGHGHNRLPLRAGPLTVAGLAADVREVVGELADTFSAPSFHYAGVSVGGAVGLQLVLDAPDRLLSAAVLCAAPRISTPESWQDRAEAVRASGTASMVAGSTDRWFAPGFLEREPDRGSALLHALVDTDDAGYVAVCEALAAFDVRDRLGGVRRGRPPLLVVAGAHDAAVPPEQVRAYAEALPGARFELLAGVAHQPPVEAPEEVARLIAEHALGLPPSGPEEVGDGLDARSRSLVTLGVLVALGRPDELAAHVVAAREDGLGGEEIEAALRIASALVG